MKYDGRVIPRWGPVLALILGATLSGCADQPVPTAYDPPGFFMGIIHGIIAPISLIGSIFLDVRIYAFPNSGIGYDFGFVLGLVPWAAR